MFEIIIAAVVIAVCFKPLGGYMARVYGGEPLRYMHWLAPVERGVYRLLGDAARNEMDSRTYINALLLFSVFSTFSLFAILLLQQWLPLNPESLPGMSPDLAFNTAVSFVTNTNWQSYAGETTLSYFSQMAGLTVQNFVSAAVGMSAAIALIRGLVRRNSAFIGNFWADTVRGIVYILLPLSILFALFYAAEGVVQTFSNYHRITTLEGKEQVIAVGPAASQIAIKMLGSNGGGFFGTNSAHPFENPTPLTNLLQLISILLIPVCMVYTFGQMVNDKRQAYAILIAMSCIFATVTGWMLYAEHKSAPVLKEITQDAYVRNMEGKEVRFGVTPSVLWAAETTATSNGSVNSAHASFMPLAALGALVFMQFGEVIYGGAGSGLYGMLTFVLITVFIAGLMVGRTPEYLGKKLGPYEIKMASLVILLPSLLVLFGTAAAVWFEAGRIGVLNPGAQGFSEILYAFTSAANNNGSAFAGLNTNTPFYNVALGIVMIIGRFAVLLAVLALAGSLAGKNAVPVSAGTLPTHNGLFIGMLIGIIVLLGVLSFAPTLMLGPIAEHIALFTRP